MGNSRARRGAVITVLLAAAWLGGCRTTPVAPELPASGTPWEQRRAQLQALTHFGFKGRVAVAAGDDGFNAGLRWQQDGAHLQLSLEGPLGVGAVRISSNGEDLNIVTAHGEQYDSEAAHNALAARLGFDPPLASLRYWVLGVPDPAQPAEETLDAQQRLSGLRQSGWRIEYTAYQVAAFGAAGGTGSAGAVAAAGTGAAQAAQWIVPSRLTLRRDSVRVRLLVDDWQP